MATYNPAKKNTEYIIYTALEDTANPGKFKTSPTLASGDFKVSIDGGALANLATLPTNTPSGSRMVKISLSAGEMNGDNITIVCVDAAGSEWNELIFNLQTVANQFDDLAATQATIAGYIDTEVAAIKAKTDNLPASPAATGDAMTLTSGAVDAILDDASEGSTTFRQMMRLWSSWMFGKVSGGGTSTIVYRDLADSKDRITLTVDSSGNRTATTLDGS